jgi:chemotaxis protein histidine kinase CheA
MAREIKESSLARRGAGVKEYLKRAFLYRWNVLLFIGGVGAAVLSPWPDAVLPLVAAAEAAYLGALVSAPKFRKAIDAAAYQQSKQASPGAENARPVQAIIDELPLQSRTRFQEIRARCLEMRTIANGVRGRTAAGAQPVEDLSVPALDRLLWVFLRLLVSQEALNRFLQRTNPDEIRLRLGEAKAKLESQTAGDERMIRSLQDSVAAHELRLQNYERANKNYEFVRVELDRIEAKIQALAETSVNRQDPDFLSSQIDSVTESMQSTEKAISELQQITGLVDELQEPPAILEAES